MSNYNYLIKTNINHILITLSVIILLYGCLSKRTISTQIISRGTDYKDTIVLRQNDKPSVKELHVCSYGFKEWMELHPNGRIYTFRSGLEDGTYVAFYKYYTKRKDTAMVAVFENGEMNGILRRWYDGKLEEECEYKDGAMNGWRKLYFYEDGKKYINIYKCKDDACVPIHEEW